MPNPDIEDLLMNPLNNIVLFADGTEIEKEINKEVDRIVALLEKEKIISKRIHPGQRYK